MNTNKINNSRSVVKIPGSKSLSHRAAIAAALAQGQSKLRNFLLCEDTLYTVSGLHRLGANLLIKGDQIHVEGCGGSLSVPSAGQEIQLGNSGTSLRLLLAVAALARGETLLTGTPRLNHRPIEPLVKALRELGVNVKYVGKTGSGPVLVRGGRIKGGRVRINATKSSQFISALLLVAPYAEKDVEIETVGNPVSHPYIDLTIETMKRFEAYVEQDQYKYFKVRAGQQYKGQTYTIEGDVSSASYFWAAAAISSSTIVTQNIHPHSTTQGDIHLLDILEQMGCEIHKDTDKVTVRGGELSGIEVDMSRMPDMVPTLAAIALFAHGKTSIRNVAHLRHKESDRLRAIATEWKKLGAAVDELQDGLIIHGGKALNPATVHPHNDHRIAMSLAAIGIKVQGIRILNHDCVRKSFPSFWSLWRELR